MVLTARFSAPEHSDDKQATAKKLKGQLKCIDVENYVSLLWIVIQEARIHFSLNEGGFFAGAK